MMTTEQYLQTNPIVKAFLDEIYKEMETHFSSAPFSPGFWDQIKNHRSPKLHIGSKFIKIEIDGGVWGFIARTDGILKGHPYRRGDLLRGATWSSPAAKSRGNIIDGTAKWDVYGPVYL
jgi:hypothetical protein